MAKISGTYTIRIADKDATDGIDGETGLTVRVKTANTDDAAAVADVIGRELDKLGLTVPEPTGDQ